MCRASRPCEYKILPIPDRASADSGDAIICCPASLAAFSTGDAPAAPSLSFGARCDGRSQLPFPSVGPATYHKHRHIDKLIDTSAPAPVGFGVPFFPARDLTQPQISRCQRRPITARRCRLHCAALFARTQRTANMCVQLGRRCCRLLSAAVVVCLSTLCFSDRPGGIGEQHVRNEFLLAQTDRRSSIGSSSRSAALVFFRRRVVDRRASECITIKASRRGGKNRLQPMQEQRF